MSRISSTANSPSPPRSTERLYTVWGDLNVRFFDGKLPSIKIVWSPRLTASSGMFVSRVGPRAKTDQGPDTRPERRLIRLSLPLLQSLSERTPYAEQEIVSTLAHEMIHQWQFDVLKRRPDHGFDFMRKMTEMNRSGLVGVTTYHSLKKEVQALSRYAWRCQQCGRIYQRHRRSIQPRRHRCGQCQGPLRELAFAQGKSKNETATMEEVPNVFCRPSVEQLRFPFLIS